MRSVILLQLILWCLYVIHSLNILLTWFCWSSTLRVLQLGAAPISSDEPVLSLDQLADQVAEVLDFFGYLSLSLSLTRAHTHTHTHTMSSLFLTCTHMVVFFVTIMIITVFRATQLVTFFNFLILNGLVFPGWKLSCALGSQLVLIFLPFLL